MSPILAAALFAVPVLFAPSVAPAASAPVAALPAPEGVTVEVVTVNGSGCPAGAGNAVLAGEELTITSPSYFAWAGEPAEPTEFRRNCQINAHVTRPAGWTYAVSGIDSAGFAHLADGSTGTTRVSVYFQGNSQTQAFTHSFPGPRSEYWETRDVVADEALVFAPCDADRNLNLNTELRATAPDPTQTNFMLRHPTTVLHLTWRKC